MNLASDAIAEMDATAAPVDIDAVFRAHYVRVARLIARVIRNRARAEELAVEVFLKLWRTQTGPIESIDAWLYRVALRVSLDELRGRGRRARYEKLFGWFLRNSAPPTPEQIHNATEEQERVRFVLGRIAPRQAELPIAPKSRLQLRRDCRDSRGSLPQGVHQTLWTTMIVSNSLLGLTSVSRYSIPKLAGNPTSLLHCFA